MKYQVLQIVLDPRERTSPKADAKWDLMLSRGLRIEDIELFSHVATVEAESLDEVFELTNLWAEPNKVEKHHGRMTSVSVGDIIFDYTGTAFIVARFGFEEIENPNMVARLQKLVPPFWPNEVDSCYDCGSTIPGHHTRLCDFAEEGDERDLPSKNFPKQAWNGITWPEEHQTDAEYEEEINAED